MSLALGGCGAGTVTSSGQVSSDSSASPSAATSSGRVPSAREGHPAASTRVRFIPKRLTLPDGAGAAVEPAQTVDGELQVPSNVNRIGWWDGSASAGDPFGSTVIAGHVDSATQGIGFFAKLERVRVGSKVTVEGDGHRLTYRVVAVQKIAKGALATDSRAFDQEGEHRLVMITCTGRYHPDRGGYDRNLVIIARPLGLAR
jgi:LPXTG-site transpeptidase (sortase) family protein